MESIAETTKRSDELPRDENGQLSAYAWPGGYVIGYLDRENSVLCVACARKSDADPDELPQFKPVAYFIRDLSDELESCAQCGVDLSTL